MELRGICCKIVARARKVEEWRAVESGDEFQTDHFEGGFDGTEDAFCFSYYAPDGVEHWFQFTIADATEIATGTRCEVQLRIAG